MMKTLTRMIFRDLIPVFLVALLFFVMILQLLDIFNNLWKFLNNDVPLTTVFVIALYYVPKCISYVLPVTILFSVTYTLGNYFANNELIAILNSGISLFRLSLPILIMGLAVSLGSFLFDQYVVIETYRIKNEMTTDLTGKKVNYNNSQVTILTEGGERIYHAVFYNDSQKELSRPLVLDRDGEGRLIRRIEADRASWEEDVWFFKKVRIYEGFGGESAPVLKEYDEFSDPALNEDPATFRRDLRNVEEMTLADAKEWIHSQMKAGLPYKEALTDYYQRFSFALTSFIVTLISCALGSRFKKNILLMSLLSSLGLSVIYYIFQMLTALMATYGTVTPLMGAWLGFILFFMGGIILFRYAPT
ncbi:MAG: LptF/LptG family permease [Spirochaetales bacterium]|nr:LptF/LptG family permease [Spirochaetales bacterium]